MTKTTAIPFTKLVTAFALLLSLLFSVTGQAQTNHALSFNGSSQVDCGTGSGFNISGTALTVEAWINPSSFAADHWEGSIVAKDGDNITGYVLRGGGTGQLSFAIAVSGNSWVEVVSANNVLSLNQWQHVAGVYDGTELRLYKDGTLIGSVAESRALVADVAFPVMIGGSPGSWTPSRNFTGEIEEARIWNVAQTPAAIKHQMFRRLSAGSGLVAAYQMSDGTGSSLTDNSGNGNTGTLTAGASWVDSPVQLGGNALSFDGSNDVVSIPSTSSLQITSAITLEAWIYASKNSGIQNVINKSSSSVNTGYIFPRTDDGWASIVMYLHVGGAWRTLSAPYPSLNAWHHCAATYDGSTMNLYIDGLLVNSLALTGTIASNSNPVTLGTQPGYANEYFGGFADEFRIWNVARTQAQIQADMINELDPALQTGLVSYYTANQGIPAGTNTALTTLVDQSGTNNGTLINFALSGSGSNFVFQKADLFVLPLEWLSFTATLQGAHSLLQWSTASEQHTKHFMIQRSQDGISWVNIGQVTAAGSSTYLSSYRYVDLQPGTGLIYYRLKQEDIDGRFSYSKVIRLSVSDQRPAYIVLTNPIINGVLQLQVNRAVELSLYNTTGGLLLKRRLSEGRASIDITAYPKGVYWLQSGREVKKLLLQ